jgi:hypothetical protein
MHVADVGLDEQSISGPGLDIINSLGAPALIDVNEYGSRPMLGEQLGGGPTDSGRGPSNQSHFAYQLSCPIQDQSLSALESFGSD